jgi:hypothetical protein
MIDMSIILYTVALMFVIVVLASISKDEKGQRLALDKEREKEKEKKKKFEEDRHDKLVDDALRLVPLTIIDVEPHVFKYINRMSLKEKNYLESLKNVKYQTNKLNRRAFDEILATTRSEFYNEIENLAFKNLKSSDKKKSLLKDKRLVRALNDSASLCIDIFSDYLIKEYNMPIDEKIIREKNFTSDAISKTRKWEE